MNPLFFFGPYCPLECGRGRPDVVARWPRYRFCLLARQPGVDVWSLAGGFGWKQPAQPREPRKTVAAAVYFAASFSSDKLRSTVRRTESCNLVVALKRPDQYRISGSFLQIRLDCCLCGVSDCHRIIAPRGRLRPAPALSAIPCLLKIRTAITVLAN